MTAMLDVAIHEAAHAVIAKHFGAEVTEMHFGAGQGVSRVHYTHKGLTKVAQAAIAYAGFVAEQRINPDASAGHDLSAFNKTLDGATDATKKRVADWTRSLVAAHWGEIQALANHLCDGLTAHAEGKS